MTVVLEHGYPSRYPKGTDPDADRMWALLDYFKPGVIPDHIRAYIVSGATVIIKEARLNERTKVTEELWKESTAP